MTNDIDAAIAAEQQTPPQPPPEPASASKPRRGRKAAGLVPEATSTAAAVDPNMPPLVERLAGAQVHQLALDRLRESPTNPRQLFPEAGLEELAEDIRKHGVLEPILVRFTEGAGKPDGAGAPLEIVFGARRFRAAQRAGLAELPVRMAEITDLEVIELQLAENLQRADLHPLEEADAFDRLHREHGLSVQEIADKYAVGKSASYVYARMKLGAITADLARRAFLKGSIDASTALLVARIPNEKLQREFAGRVLEGRVFPHDRAEKDAEPLGYRESLDVYHREFMLRLADAPFSKDDATLVPAAGPCTTCPKRTGNQRELFSDVPSADVCTDTACFGAKKAAWVARRVAEAKEKGLVVLQGKATKTVAPFGIRSHMPGHVALDEHCYHDPKSRTYQELLADQLKLGPEGQGRVRPQLLVGEGGELREVLPKKDMQRALKDAGYKFAQRAKPDRGRSTSDSSSSAKYKEQDRKNQLEAEVVETVANTAVERLAELAEKDKASGKLLELLIRYSAGNYFVAQALVRRGFKKVGTSTGAGVAKQLERAGLKEPRLRGVLLEINLLEEMETYGDSDGAFLQAAAEAYRLDLGKLEKEIRARLEAAGAPKCRKCGCTETTPCIGTSGPCAWEEKPDKKTRLGLCTACVGKGKKAAPASGSAQKKANANVKSGKKTAKKGKKR